MFYFPPFQEAVEHIQPGWVAQERQFHPAASFSSLSPHSWVCHPSRGTDRPMPEASSPLKTEANQEQMARIVPGVHTFPWPSSSQPRDLWGSAKSTGLVLPPAAEL